MKNVVRIPGGLARLAAISCLALPAGALRAGTPPPAPAHAAGLHTLHGAARQAAAGLLASLPLRFEPNRGQAAPEARFVARGLNSELFLTDHGATLVLARPAALRHGARRAATAEVVQMSVLGADPRARGTAEGLLAGHTGYFLGNHPAAWRTSVPNYARVAERAIYPGIDLVYSAERGALVYDFVLAPGADPARIRLAFAGVRGLALDGRGNLLLRLRTGTLTEAAPRLYQQTAHGRVAVAGRFTLLGPGRVGFTVGRHDAARPLVIDPSVLYGTYLGGPNEDYGMSIQADAQGNILLDGMTFGPTAAGLPTPTPGFGYRGKEDVFVAKLHPAGAGSADLVYFDFLGGSADDDEYDDWGSNTLVVDGAGNAYVLGTTYSQDFPTTPGAFQTTNMSCAPNTPLTTNCDANAFVAKLNPTGTALIYSTLVGGGGYTPGVGLFVDAAGDAYLTGEADSGSVCSLATRARRTAATTCAVTAARTAAVTPYDTTAPFPTTNGTTFNDSIADAYVSVLNPSGTGLLYSTLLGGTAYDAGVGLAVDAAGNIVVDGVTDSTDFPGTASGYQPQHDMVGPTGGNGGTANDVFVAKLNPRAGATLSAQVVAATYLGGRDDDSPAGVAVDPQGNIVLAGTTRSSNFPLTPGAFQTAYSGFQDGYVAKFNPALSRLLYATLYESSTPGIGSVYVNDMAMDGAGTVYITGNALGQIPTTAGALPLSPNATTPPSGAFLAAFFPTLAVQAAQQLAYGTYLDGAGRVGRFFEDSYGVGVDAAGNAYLTGSTACCLNSGPGNPNLPVTPGAFQTAPGGADDAYAVKIGPGPLTSSAAAPAPICTTALTLARGALHLGLIAGARTALQAPYPLGYVTFQNGASSLVLRRPTLTCVGPGLSSAVITLTGPVFSGYGIYQPGDLVTVTVTGSGGAMFAGASYTVEVKVTRGVTTVSDTTLTGVPWSQNGHLVVMPF